MRISPLIVVFLTAAGPLSAAPGLSVEQAVTVAQKHLEERAPGGGFYITSVKLETRSARPRWAVDWSAPVPIDELKKETGIEIAMDGSIVSLVKGPPNKDPKTGKFDPNGPTGLQNYRTRSDRPSILDLKR